MPSAENKRIAKNTTLLYFRMLFTMLVKIYTSRVILSVLGVSDYGIYNVVGGLVAIFTILNSSMGAASSRFLIFELGKKDYPQLKKVFNAALASHIGIALLVLLVAETIGLWFLTHKLVIPEARMNAAMWAYQFSVLTAMVTLTQVPYTALIIAHEKMNIYAYVSFLEVFLRLMICYLLTVGGFDRLKFYAILGFLVSLINALVYRFYCSKNYPESSLSFHWDKKLYKTLFSFSIWDLYGSFAIMGMGQGVNMLLNMFFGPVVNAARGVAYSLQGAISGFETNFMLAVKPQIVKLYADNKIPQMMKLVFAASKYAYFLTIFLTLPVLIETRFILNIWLKTTPDYTVNFVRLVLINNLITSLHAPIVNSFHAVGRIKIPNLICGSIFYLVLIGSYICLKLGFPPESVFIVTIAVTLIEQTTELIILKRMIDYSIKAYFREVVLLALIVTLVSAILPYIFSTFLTQGFIRFLIIGFTCVTTVGISVYFIGLDKQTKAFAVRKIIEILYKFKLKKA